MGFADVVLALGVLGVQELRRGQALVELVWALVELGQALVVALLGWCIALVARAFLGGLGRCGGPVVWAQQLLGQLAVLVLQLVLVGGRLLFWRRAVGLVVVFEHAIAALAATVLRSWPVRVVCQT